MPLKTCPAGMLAQQSPTAQVEAGAVGKVSSVFVVLGGVVGAVVAVAWGLLGPVESGPFLATVGREMGVVAGALAGVLAGALVGPAEGLPADGQAAVRERERGRGGDREGGPPGIADCAQTRAVVGQIGWPQAGGEFPVAGVCAGGGAWDWVGWVEVGGGV